MKSFLLFVFVFGFFSAADGADPRAAHNQEISDSITATTNEVVKVVQKKMSTEDPACFSCVGDQAPPKSCADAYADLYSKPTLDFRITLGYTDMPNTVVNAEDLPRRNLWVTKMLRPCPEGAVGTCGFKRDPDDMDLFTKVVTGPDGKGHTVNVHLVASSVSVDDKLNRTVLQAQQEAQTKRAEANFYDHLCTSDFPIYAGHARNGGGPSFAPPILHADGLNADEKAYANRESEKRMLDILRNCPTPPKLIALFACKSDVWFSQEVRNATKDKKSGLTMTGIASSNGLTEPEIVFAHAYAALDSVLALRCKDQFVHSLNSILNVLRHDGHGASLIGFFGDPHPPFTPVNDEPAVPQKYRSEMPVDSQPAIHPPGAAPKEPVRAGNGIK